jgi:hypothetical protein
MCKVVVDCVFIYYNSQFEEKESLYKQELEAQQLGQEQIETVEGHWKKKVYVTVILMLLHSKIILILF